MNNDFQNDLFDIPKTIVYIPLKIVYIKKNVYIHL